MSIFVVIRYHYWYPEETLMKSIHTEKYRQIGLKIAYYRKLRGLTQEELAEQVGLTPAYIGHLEAPNISKALSLDTLFDIADALHVDAQKFLMFEESWYRYYSILDGQYLSYMSFVVIIYIFFKEKSTHRNHVIW